MNLAEQVRQQLQRVPEGGIIASRALQKLSTNSQQVDKAVSRLYKAEGLQKIRNGLYYKPYNSKYFGELPPREEDIIRSIKQQYNAKVSPSGALAAFELGLTHTLPDTITYETDKRISPIELDNHTLCFLKVDDKKLSSVKESLLTKLKALEFLYKENKTLTPLQEKRIRRLLNRYPNVQLTTAIELWPRWFQEQVKPLIQATDKPYITGLSALNVPYQGKQADWHQMGMLYSNKFQIAGRNYESAPGISEHELFDCSRFLNKFSVDIGTTLCATPTRAVKDILFNSIIKNHNIPAFSCWISLCSTAQHTRSRKH
ncbi:MAG TPA: hypothetical protein ENI05_11610 [Porticoccus sp.]|nr:hypothetical protein [Porticoccus sp.]